MLDCYARFQVGLVLLLFCPFLLGFSPNIITENNASELKQGLIPSVKIVPVGKTSDLDINDVLLLLDDVEPVMARLPNFGFSEESYWVAFSIENHSLKSNQFFLEVAYSMLDEVSYWEYDDLAENVLKYIETGDKKEFSQRPLYHPNFIFPTHVDAGEKRKILIKITTNSSSQFPLRIWSQEGLTNSSQVRATLTGALIGVVLILGIYNFLLYLSLRDISYLYMLFIMFGYAGVESVLTGFGYYYLWPFSPYWQNISLIVISNFSLASLYLFSRSFLSLPEMHPRFGSILYACAIISLMLSVLSFFIPYKNMIIITALNVMIAPILSYMAGFYLMLKKYKPAYFYTSAFLVYVISSTIFILSKLGFLPGQSIFEYSIHIGTIVTVVLLSFALADRIKREKKEKEEAKEFAIDNLEKYRTIYENSLEGMFRISLDGRLLACNPAFAKLMGEKGERELLEKVDLLSQYIAGPPESLDALNKDFRKFGHVLGHEIKCFDTSGRTFWAALYAKYIDDKKYGRFIDASIVDITEKKETEEKLNFLAKHDPLTGVANRAGFEAVLENAIFKARELSKLHSLLFMDLDQFKIINDTCGHSAGDEMLKQMTAVFNNHIRENDSMARMGGDEFVILLDSCPIDRAFEIANRLRKEVSEYKFFWNENVFSVGISIGIVPVDGQISSSEEVLSLADMACYAAKDAGKNRVVVQLESSEDIPERQTDMNLVNSVKGAIDDDALVLYKQVIQPICEDITGDIYEVLVRLPVDEGGLILPGRFIPALERFDSIERLDFWVTETFLQWLFRSPEKLSSLYRANINISGRTLSNPSFESYLLSLFDKYHIPKEKVCFEITESEAISNLSSAKESLERLVQNGFQFSLDDFGSGFSSYTYLKVLPVQSLKIDGGFVRNITESPVDAAMVQSIIHVAHTMGLQVTAEFVENEEVFNKLKDMKVDFVQGYYIHKPEYLDLTES